MSHPTRYREIEVRGTPREMGHQLGEAAGEEIRQFCDIALSGVNKITRVSLDSALKVVAGAMPCIADYAPHMMDELCGIAEAARVSLEQILLLQVRNQLQADGGGCTSLALRDGAGRAGNLVAQNWDNDPELDAVTVVVTRRPVAKPALMTVTQAGLIAYIGLNDAGIGVCLNTLPAPARTLGVPHYFTVRGIYESTSLDGAVDAVRRATRAIPANIMLATPQGPADLEVTIDGVRVLQPGAGCGIAHTNHCLHPSLAALNDQFPELIQSRSRDRRIRELIDFSAVTGSSREDVEWALRDHANHPRSICRHANDDAVTGFWQTVFSVIIETDARRMHITRGTPCDHAYERYELP